MNELLKKLKSLGIHIDNAATMPHVEKNGKSLQTLFSLKGKWVEQRDGRVYVVEETLPFGYSHGSITFQESLDLSNLKHILEKSPFDELRLGDIAFLDVETSSLSSGSGTLAFLIGICSFNQSGVNLVQIFLDDPIHEPVFINYLDNMLLNTKLLVTYNGKTFDIPVLKTRYSLNRIPHQFNSIAHIDLLAISRKLWRLRLESRTLSSIEREILEFHRDQTEVPGWLVPQLYYDYLQTGDAAILEGVFYHNKMDILSLSALFQYVISLLSNEDMIFGSEGLDIFSIACLLIPQIEVKKIISLFDKSINKGIPVDKKIKVFKKIAAYYKKNLIWDRAIILWEHNANLGDCFSCVELAKYYEHQINDIQKAVSWVEKAEKIISLNTNSIDLSELISRKKRLLHKIERKNENH